jgi:predicted acyltransferase
MKFIHVLVGYLAAPPLRRDQRGLSQSTEVAILTGVVVTVAVTVGTAITIYVNAKLPRP